MKTKYVGYILREGKLEHTLTPGKNVGKQDRKTTGKKCWIVLRHGRRLNTNWIDMSMCRYITANVCHKAADDEFISQLSTMTQYTHLSFVSLTISLYLIYALDNN
jgi:hypothetical protein